VPRLVDGKLRAIWQADRGQKPPALIRDFACHFHSLAPQVAERGLDVVAHEVELVMAATLSWMDSKFGRGQGENEPAPARIRRRQAEDVGEERADLLGFGREHDRMYSGDHAVIITAARPVAVT
jgi:hypothetical protein